MAKTRHTPIDQKRRLCMYHVSRVAVDVLAAPNPRIARIGEAIGDGAAVAAGVVLKIVVAKVHRVTPGRHRQLRIQRQRRLNRVACEIAPYSIHIYIE